MHVDAGLDQIAGVRSRARVDTDGAVAGGAGAVHGERVALNRHVECGAQRGRAIAMREGEDAGILSDLRDGVADDLDRRRRVVFGVHINRRSDRCHSTAPDVRIAVDVTLDHRVVDAEDVDDRAAVAVDLRVSIDVEVQMRRVLGVESDRSTRTALRIEHVAGADDAAIGDVHVHRRRIPRERFDARCLEVQEIVV